MKKIGIILIAVTFIIFLFIGYQLTSNLDSNTGKQPTTIQVASSAIAHQDNFIFVHVTNLQDPQPRLVSVWSVFVYFNSPITITFVPLYPQNGLSPTSGGMGNAFSLTDQTRLTTAFQQNLQSYKFPFKGYILIDDQAFNLMTRWLTQADPPYQSSNNLQSGDTAAIISQEGQMASIICPYINKPYSVQMNSNIQWNQIIPAHFATDLNFETIVTDWEKLTNSDLPPNCEIVTEQQASQ
jgi:hypothetical protein